MPWEIVEGANCELSEVNRAGVELIMRSFLRADSMLRNAATKTETHFFGPDLVSVEVDFKKVRADVDANAPAFVDDFFTRLRQGMRRADAVQFLADLREQTRELDADLKQKQRTAQHQTMTNISTSVDRGETALPVLEAVRDMSAEGLMVGATMLTGGAALAVIGAGATLKGVAKYQDTGHVGEAVVEGTANLVYGVIGMGVDSLELKGTEKVVMTFVVSQNEGLIDTARSNAFGNTALQSFKDGGKTFISDPTIDLVVKDVAFKGKASLWVVPIVAGAKWATGKILAPAKDTPKPAGQAGAALPRRLTLIDSAIADQEFIERTVLRSFAPVSRL